MKGGSEISTRRKKLLLFFNLGHDVLCNRLGSPGTSLSESNFDASQVTSFKTWQRQSQQTTPALNRSLRDFPLRYDMRGDSLKISLSRCCFCIRCRFPTHALCMSLPPTDLRHRSHASKTIAHAWLTNSDELFSNTWLITKVKFNVPENTDNPNYNTL